MDNNKEYRKIKQRGMFINLTRKKAREEIRRIEEERGITLTKAQKNKIAKKEAQKVKVKVKIYGALFLGAVLGGSGQKLLNEASTKGIDIDKQNISIDAEKYDGNIEIQNKNNTIEYNNEKDEAVIYTNEFKQGLKIDVETLSKAKKLKANVENEIDNLDNKEEVLDYLKEMYVNEYNDENGTCIGIKNIELHKERGEYLMIDSANNGDTICRKITSEEKKSPSIKSEIGTVEAIIKVGENRKITKVTNNKGNYIPVYEENDEVENVNENALMKIGGIIDNGIDYYAAFDAHSKETMEYKQRLIDSIVEYKESKINEIVEGKNSKECKISANDGYEMGD